VVSPDQQRAAADYLGERYGVSQRRICRVMGRSRSGLRYRRKRRSDEPALNREIKRLARRYPRYGHRRIHALLVRGGWSVNLKRIRRLWNGLGLRRPLRLRKPRKLETVASTVLLSSPFTGVLQGFCRLFSGS